MKKRSEHSSTRVARLAAEILGAGIAPDQTIPLRRSEGPPFLTSGEFLLSICGSVVTQAQDHAERETIRKGKLPKGHRRIKVHKPVKRRMLHP